MGPGDKHRDDTESKPSAEPRTRRARLTLHKLRRLLRLRRHMASFLDRD